MINQKNTINTLFNDLIAENGNPGQRVRRRIDHSSPLPVYATCVFPQKNLMLEIGPVKSAWLPQGFSIPLIKGINITLECQEHELGSDASLLLELQQDEDQDVFAFFLARICEELDRLDKPKAAIRTVIALIEKWKIFFTGVHEILSEGQQTGLYGELYLLMEFATDKINIGKLVSAWTGSRRTNQDFEFGTTAVEVKSSVAVDPATVKITNVRQLDETGLDALFLARILLDARQGSDRTLPKLIREIRKLINDSAPDVYFCFEERLLLSGYFDRHEDQYANRSYSEREIVYYKVREGFPRLLENNLPVGVTKISYEITLETCSAFIVAEDSLINAVRKACD